MNLILADNMRQGREIMSSCNLQESECAVLNQASYWDHVKLQPKEIVYAHANASSKLFVKFKTLEGADKVNLKIITP